MDEEIKLKIGKQIENARMTQRLSLQDIATALKTSKQNIDRYQTGSYKKPDHELLNKIFDFLNIDKKLLPVISGPKIEDQEIELHPVYRRLEKKYLALLEKVNELKK